MRTCIPHAEVRGTCALTNVVIAYQARSIHHQYIVNICQVSQGAMAPLFRVFMTNTLWLCSTICFPIADLDSATMTSWKMTVKWLKAEFLRNLWILVCFGVMQLRIN